MSFILDALKKSEAERQRQSGPTLLELRITRPRRRYPVWAVVVGLLLAANVVVLLAFVLRKPAAIRAPNASDVSAGPAAIAAAAPAPAAVTASAPAAAQPSAAALVAPQAAPNPSSTPAGPTLSDHAALQPAANAASPAADTRNPADYQAAVSASSAPLPVERSADYSNLPSLTQMGGHMPALQLDLLDYSEHASERYALINMHRVHEGDVLPEGARVLAITRDGVALAYGGQNFMLRPAGAPQ